MTTARTLATLGLTAGAMVAFAANSILTRMALGPRLVDAATFTTIRLLSGAIVLAALVRWQSRGEGVPPQATTRPWAGPLALFVYAAPFTFAYLRIGAAAGALVLFGAVQLTMVGWGLARGERPGVRAWIGLALGCSGLVALTLPGAERPDPLGAGLMVVAGVSWGIYSLLGRGATQPLAANARSFLWSVPLALLLSLATGATAHATATGASLAVVSGGVTSALGYAVWYRALRGLSAAQAAVAQLSVPVIAALGAVAFLGEPLHMRVVAAGAIVLGGVALALSAPARRT